MARLNGDGSVEPTGDEGALHAARVFAKALDDARTMQNGVGAWIGRQVPGATSPARAMTAARSPAASGPSSAKSAAASPPAGSRSFDWANARFAQSTAEASAPFGEWRDFIRPRLDPKTFDGLEARRPVADGQVRRTRATQEQRQMARPARRSTRCARRKTLAAKGIIKDPADLSPELMLHLDHGRTSSPAATPS